MLEFFRLKEQPFGVTPNPRMLYLTAAHAAAADSLRFGVESGLGFMALLAPPGMGKTTLLFQLLEQLESSARTAYLFNTQCAWPELFRNILSELEISNTGDTLTQRGRFHDVLLEESRVGRRVVVVIDEAQNLNEQVLESVRLLSDFETPSFKLVQIILAGQLQLAERLSTPGLVQLRQRISTFCRLDPLSVEECAGYISHRLAAAGHSGEEIFTPDAARMIAMQSEGIPRAINNMCFSAMALAHASGQRHVDTAIIHRVLDGLGMGRQAPEASRLTAPAAPNVAPRVKKAVEVAPAATNAAATAAAPPVAQDFITAAGPSDIRARLAIESATADDRPNHRAETIYAPPPGRAGWIAAAVLTLIVLAGWGTFVAVKADYVSEILPGPLVASEPETAPASTMANDTPTQGTKLSLDGGTSLGGEARSSSGNAGRRETKSGLNLTTSSPQPSRARVITAPQLERTTLAAGAEEDAAPLDPSQVHVASAAASGLGNAPLPAATVYVPKLAPESRRSQVTLARLTKSVPPVYPPAARAAGIEGEVVLSATITRDGIPTDLTIVSGAPALREAALDAVRRWRYEPQQLNGERVDVPTEVRVKFRLR